LPLGPYLGWVTAANAVSLTAEAVRQGLVAPGGAGEAALGTALLLVGAVLACAVILAGRAGPVQGYLAYGATVLWARTGIVVNQYAFSPVTTGAALLAAVLVAVVLVRPSGADLETISPWISAGEVRPVIDRGYSLSEAVEAHHYSESRRVRGKLVLVVDGQLASASAESFSSGEVPGGTAA
jgi:hypothetical protein